MSDRYVFISSTTANKHVFRVQRIVRRLGIVVVAVLTLLYSVLLAGRFLSWFGIVIPLLGLYLFWRFVRAVERIAGEMER